MIKGLIVILMSTATIKMDTVIKRKETIIHMENIPIHIKSIVTHMNIMTITRKSPLAISNSLCLINKTNYLN